MSVDKLINALIMVAVLGLMFMCLAMLMNLKVIREESKPDMVTRNGMEVTKFISNCKGTTCVQERGGQYTLRCDDD